jgi:hypothetical protein
MRGTPNQDESKNWRIVVRVDPDAIVVAGVFEKKTRTHTHQEDDRLPRPTQTVRRSGEG